MTTKETRTKFAPFEAEDITQIYFGGDAVCRCGCAGEYFTPEDEGFNSKVKRFMRLFKAGHDKIAPIYDGGVCINITTGKSRYTGGAGNGKALCAYFD